MGEEQSGHIKEVGFEYLSSMLEEAILNLRPGVAGPVGGSSGPADHHRQAVLIPEIMFADLFRWRLSLYRRLADLDTRGDRAISAALTAPTASACLPELCALPFRSPAIKGMGRRANVRRSIPCPEGGP